MRPGEVTFDHELEGTGGVSHADTAFQAEARMGQSPSPSRSNRRRPCDGSQETERRAKKMRETERWGPSALFPVSQTKSRDGSESPHVAAECTL